MMTDTILEKNNINQDDNTNSSTDPNISSCFFEIPIDALSEETKNRLKYLDCRFIIHDEQIAKKDYRGLAMLMNYNMMELNYLIDHKGLVSPTLMILEKMKKENKTMGDLIRYLRILKRFDVLSNVRVPMIQDARDYRNKRSNNQRDIPHDAHFVTNIETKQAQDTINKYITTDIVVGMPQPRVGVEPSSQQEDSMKYYDVFLSFNSESSTDMKIMQELSKVLESAGISVAKGSFSFFEGCVLVEAYAQAIYSKCRKVILLLSNSFLESECCVMQLNYAMDSDKALWRRKVIPVYIEAKVRVPQIIANVNAFHYYDPFIRREYLSRFVEQMKP